MDLPLVIQEPVQAHEDLCREQFNQMFLWLMIVAVAVCAAFYVDAEIKALSQFSVELLLIALVAALPLLLISGFKSWLFFRSKNKLAAYQTIRRELERCRLESSPEIIQQALSEASMAAKSNALVINLFEYYQPILKERMTVLHRDNLQKSLNEEFNVLRLKCDKQVNIVASNVPLIKARDQINTSLRFLTIRRQEMAKQWEASYENFSWWNKLKYSAGPGFSEIDDAIRKLELLHRKMQLKHEDDFKNLDMHFEMLKQQAVARMSDAKVKAEQFIQDGHYEDEFNASMLNKALWFSAMSVPVSVWADVDSAINVYDALRGVNGNFAGMNDAEIWWESLLMPAESLAGLTALTKGAYFEELVAADSGGQLHEHFNQADTDIVIDGVAFQLKATGSESYIYSVDESIPVIATSEVAASTGVIDSGYSDEEITNTVDSALGGTVVDIGDTAADAILAGLGGLGLFATIQGINHASAKYENGGDGVEAIFEGAGVAVEGTARALVGAAEMGYNVLNSRPSRFVGRTLLKGLVKLDEKLFEEPTKK